MSVINPKQLICIYIYIYISVYTYVYNAKARHAMPPQANHAGHIETTYIKSLCRMIKALDRCSCWVIFYPGMRHRFQPCNFPKASLAVNMPHKVPMAGLQLVSSPRRDTGRLRNTHIYIYIHIRDTAHHLPHPLLNLTTLHSKISWRYLLDLSTIQHMIKLGTPPAVARAPYVCGNSTCAMASIYFKIYYLLTIYLILLGQLK